MIVLMASNVIMRLHKRFPFDDETLGGIGVDVESFRLRRIAENSVKACLVGVVSVLHCIQVTNKRICPLAFTPS
jgi:hypothetical protein